MATYKDIVGTAVRNNAGNLPAPETGQVWFDSTNIDFKYQQPNTTTSGSWRTATDLPYDATGVNGVGTQTAALVFGGEAPPGVTGQTEDWNGVSWVEVADMSTARKRLGGSGTTTAGLAFAGIITAATAATEEWSGTSNSTKTISTD